MTTSPQYHTTAPSNGVTSPNVAGLNVASMATDRLLIVDDSNQIRSTFVANIIRACNLNNRPYRLIHSDPAGLIETTTAGDADSFGSQPLIIYTANSPRNALPVLDLPEIRRLIIVSDIMMPGDTRVGLIGLMHELARLRLPVSLLFASSERQNRYYVEEVIQSGKAHFMDKGGASWSQLPFWLAEKSQQFQYKVISQADFDRGSARSAVATAPVNAWQPQDATVKASPQVAKVGLWNRLAFWKK